LSQRSAGARRQPGGDRPNAARCAGIEIGFSAVLAADPRVIVVPPYDELGTPGEEKSAARSRAS